MIYELLTTISAALSTATPIPTPTATISPLDINIVNGNGLEVITLIVTAIGVFATFVLGKAALKASNLANKASETANKASEIANSIAQQQLIREEE